MPHETYNVGCYLLDRLTEIGCEHLFGVPGDYNLRFLDDVMCHEIKWVGCANELNAAYAADGYARHRGIGAVLTTGGVGELSALNAVAGSAAESVPVVHITGSPSTTASKNHQKMHHTLGDGDFTHFRAISAQVCCTAVTLRAETAITEIDRVLLDVLFNKKPGYIALPSDLAEMPAKPPTACLQRREAVLNSDSVAAFKSAIAARLATAQKPAVLVGHLLGHFGLSKEANRFFEKVHIPYAVCGLGKGAVSEHLESFVGTYFPGTTPGPSKAVVEGADVCIFFGVELTDGNTSLFQHKIDMANVIDIQPFFSKVGDEHFQQVPMAAALEVLEEVCLGCHARWGTNYPEPETFKAPSDPNTFDSTHFWNEIQDSLRPGDIIIVDLGTAAFSSLLLNLPEDATYMNQQLWASIGYSLPAALGVQLAQPDRRVVCIIGDGAAQMTVQELGTFARHHLNTNIFLLNNDGYTIERHIRGPHAPYNDIATWDWKTLATGLCPGGPLKLQHIDKPNQTAEVLKAREGRPTDLLFAEVMLTKFDGPLRAPVPISLHKE